VADPGWRPEAAVPFSSARKWSGASFDGRGSWLMGAPDVLLGDDDDELRSRVADLAAAGRRVLLVARSDAPLTGEEVPPGLRPAALVVLEERVRAEAPDTIAFFREQGVEVKVISGDHPGTAGAVAAAVGVDVGGGPVDARDLPEGGEELAQVVEDHNVFGRVTPHQKRAMVSALQARGHVVAMTGDGVNDVLALKQADIGVAMGAGSGASRGVAQMVLLDDSFATLPGVVAEGRRVIANVERVANLFVTKSVYAFLLSVTVGLVGVPFPFFPRHLTVVSSLTIGIPAFFLALAPNASRARPGFTGRVLRFAVPAGAVAAGATFAGYAIARAEPGVTTAEARTTAVLVLFGVAMWVLAILARPVDEAKTVLVGSMVLLFVLVMLLPPTRSFFELNAPHGVLVMAAIGVVACANALLESGWRLMGWGSRRWGRQPEPWTGQAASAASEPDATTEVAGAHDDGTRRSA
jgi:cation-transporting P-type ATPase E